MEEEIKKIEEENLTDSSVKKPSKKSNSLVTWLILTVGLLIILTIIVLIGLKIQKNRILTESHLIQEEEIHEEVNESPKTLTKKELIDQALYYPKATGERTDHDYDLVLFTNDSVATIYDYYEELIALNNWGSGFLGLASDGSGGFLHVYQNDFNADIEIIKTLGATEIDIRVDYKEEIPLTSTLNRPLAE